MSQINPAFTNASPAELAIFANTSAIPPPNGVTPNFKNAESRGSLQIAVTSVLLGLMILFFINRIWVKLFLNKKVAWDDGTQLRLERDHRLS
jgi:hypothetical protein